jgi:hypothetical protein
MLSAKAAMFREPDETGPAVRTQRGNPFLNVPACETYVDGCAASVWKPVHALTDVVRIAVEADLTTTDHD